VDLRLPSELAAGYKNPAQRARVVTEAWATQNLYCASCDSERLESCAPNTEAIDFNCPRCATSFQLKSQSRPFSGRIVDAAYDAMLRRIREAGTPSLLALHYDLRSWKVLDLLLIPGFAFSTSSIERRRPLSAGARRHGWVGCNILLVNIPPDARIALVTDGELKSRRSVRHSYARLRALEGITLEARGWTLDVLNAVRRMDKKDFKLADVYAFADDLARLHPGNRHVEPKIRQQLQRLRDLGFIGFLGGGNYRLR
jgi:type II restriction enzyme